MSDVKGGVEQLLIQIFRNIDKTKIHFDFLSLFPVCAYEEELLQAGSSVFHITRRGENPIRSRRELKAFFQSHRDTYQYIWIHMSSASHCAPNIYARKYTQAKIISHSHGTSFECRGKLAHWIHLFLHKNNREKFLRATDYCFACSTEAGRWLFGNQDRHVYTIKNAIETEKFQYDPEVRQQMKDELDLNGYTVFGHVGRFTEIKNHKFLLEIYAEIFKKNSQTCLLLVGEGELLEEMKEKASALGLSKQVFFAGFRPDFNCLLQAFDVLLLPSFSGGFPVSVVEAQAGGVPCLISDTITREVQVTSLVEYESLDAPASLWADRALEAARRNEDCERSAYAAELKEKGYNIKDTAAWLEEFFEKHLWEEVDED